MFSTFTDSAGRVRLAPPGSGRPVRGAVGGAAVVVVRATVVVGDVVVAAFSPPPPEVASTAPTPTVARTSTTTIEITMLRVRGFTYISCNRLMRSSRGGWVSKSLLNFEPCFFSSVSSGCSIHICAVAFVA